MDINDAPPPSDDSDTGDFPPIDEDSGTATSSGEDEKDPVESPAASVTLGSDDDFDLKTPPQKRQKPLALPARPRAPPRRMLGRAVGAGLPRRRLFSEDDDEDDKKRATEQVKHAVAMAAVVDATKQLNAEREALDKARAEFDAHIKRQRELVQAEKRRRARFPLPLAVLAQEASAGVLDTAARFSVQRDRKHFDESEVDVVSSFITKRLMLEGAEGDVPRFTEGGKQTVFDATFAMAVALAEAVYEHAAAATVKGEPVHIGAGAVKAAAARFIGVE